LEASKAVADGVLDACEGVVEGVQYATVKGLIPLAEDALDAAKKAGNAAFSAAQNTLKGVDAVTSEALNLAQQTLSAVQKGGDAAWKGAESALDAFVKAQKVVLDAAQKAIDDLVKSAEWLAYQSASMALDVAKHATKSLDVVKGALDLMEKGDETMINLSEDIINGVLTAIDIQKVELDGTLGGLLGKSGKHFTASVEGKLLGKPFKFDNVELDLKSTEKFIKNIFDELVKKL